MIVLASLLVAAGLLLAYARITILDGSRFSARAVSALDQTPVRDEFVRRLSNEIVSGGSLSEADRASVSSVMTTVVGGDNFRSDFRNAVKEVHHVVLDDSNRPLELRFDQAATIAADALRPTSPELAAKAKERLSGFAVQLAGRRDAVDAVQAASALKLLALIVPAVALALFVLGVALARRKAVGWAWTGIGISAAGVLTSAVAVLGRDRITTNVASISRPAVRGTWDAIVGDLRWWGLVAFGVGAVLAGAAAAGAQRQNRRRAARTTGVRW